MVVEAASESAIVAVPFVIFQFVPPLLTQEPQVGAPPPDEIRHSPPLPAAALAAEKNHRSSPQHHRITHHP